MRRRLAYWATVALTATCRLDCACAFAVADLVMDFRINAARAGTQTHIDFIELLMGHGWEPMPTMTIRTAVKIAKRRMG